MHFQGRRLKKGSLLLISSTNQLIRIVKTAFIGNGKTQVVYVHTDSVIDGLEKKQIYLNVLELMGLEWVDLPGASGEEEEE
jgi:hypothetical protein